MRTASDLQVQEVLGALVLVVEGALVVVDGGRRAVALRPGHVATRTWG
jgi:hypothetical protein